MVQEFAILELFPPYKVMLLTRFLHLKKPQSQFDPSLKRGRPCSSLTSKGTRMSLFPKVSTELDRKLESIIRDQDVFVRIPVGVFEEMHSSQIAIL